jgi:heptosyltransferase III
MNSTGLGRFMRTLIYHAGALGDFITTLPALEWWRRQHPNHFIVLAGKPELARLAKFAGIVDEIWDVQSAQWAALYNHNPDAALLDPFRQFQDAILFAIEASPLPGIMQKAGVERIWRQLPFPAVSLPIIEYHLTLFGADASLANPQDPFMQVRGKLIKNKMECHDDALEAMIHPGSGSLKKNWPLESFRQLAGCLGNCGCRVTWISGPAEEQWDFPAEDGAILRADLVELAQRMSGASLYVGNDSGVTHLAAAMGCPTIALLGPTDPTVWAPRGPAVRIISSSEVPVHRGELLPSDFSGSSMDKISVEEVWQACRTLLTRARQSLAPHSYG